jgi:hypothetical protein
MTCPNVEYEKVHVYVPDDCPDFPSMWHSRNLPFQKLTLWLSDRLFYVATEAKIYKYDHVLNFARVHIMDDGTPVVKAIESISICYEVDYEEEERMIRLDAEVSAMMPKGSKAPVNGVGVGAGAGTLAPSAMFDFHVQWMDGWMIVMTATPGARRARWAAITIGRAWRRHRDHQRRAVAAIEAAWLAYSYSPGGPGQARTADAWQTRLQSHNSD